MKESNRSFVHWVISVVIGLFILTMLAVVVYDRYEFHKLVNQVASNDIGTIKKQQRCTEIDSSKISIDSSIINITNSQKTNNNVGFLSELLQKTDGLLSANGLTYLVTLIVALLASFLLTKIDAMEIAIKGAEASEKKMEEATKISTGLNREIGILKDKLTQSLDKNKEQRERLEAFEKKLEQSLEESKEQGNRHRQLENKTELYFKHLTKFDYMLNQIASIFNLSIMIKNATSSLSPSKSDEENENIAKEVGGSLCSRLELIYDNNIKDFTIDYLITGEKNILKTYLDDARSALKGSWRSANRINNELLKVLINNNIDSVKKIIEMIDNVDIRDENKA